jgi:hypothetical protein
VSSGVGYATHTILRTFLVLKQPVESALCLYLLCESPLYDR